MRVCGVLICLRESRSVGVGGGLEVLVIQSRFFTEKMLCGSVDRDDEFLSRGSCCAFILFFPPWLV